MERGKNPRDFPILGADHQGHQTKCHRGSEQSDLARHGVYTTKLSYHTAIQRRTEAVEHQEENMELEWFKFVWNLYVSPKIKMFLWKMFQQDLPVGEVLAARHISSEVRCKRCGTSESIPPLSFREEDLVYSSFRDGF